MSDVVQLPNLAVTKDLIERVQFSLSSRNAENKVAESIVHVFASKMVEMAQDIQWQYVASGVPCLLRNRELHNNGRKYMWVMNLCLYNAHYGVLVWKAKLAPNSDYTTVADNFHVFAMSEVNVIIGLLFSSKDQAYDLNMTYTTWHQERQRDDGKKGPASSSSGAQGPRFRKEMISKPCNFQHIQGTQALDECLEIEKIKADIIAALFGLGTAAGRSETDGQPQKKKTKKAKHEITKPKLSFKMISVPRTSLNTPPISPPLSPLSVVQPISEPSLAHEQLHTTHSVQVVEATVDISNGYQTTQEELPPPQVSLPPADPSPEPVQPSLEISQPPLELVKQEPPPSEVTTNFSTTEFIKTINNNQDLQPPPTYDQLDNDDKDYDHLDSTCKSPIPNNSSQTSFVSGESPPRLDLNLEKEFTESVLFQSTLMTAN